MRRWHLTVGLGVAAVGAAILAPTLARTVAAVTSAPSEPPLPTSLGIEPAPIPELILPDEPVDVPIEVSYRDADADGYGDPETLIRERGIPEGYVALAGDCDDRDAGRHPGAAEVAGDGVDQDCDGRDLPLPRAQRPSPGPTLLIPELDARPLPPEPVPSPEWDGCPACGRG